MMDYQERDRFLKEKMESDPKVRGMSENEGMLFTLIECIGSLCTPTDAKILCHPRLLQYMACFAREAMSNKKFWHKLPKKERPGKAGWYLNKLYPYFESTLEDTLKAGMFWTCGEEFLAGCLRIPDWYLEYLKQEARKYGFEGKFTMQKAGKT